MSIVEEFLYREILWNLVRKLDIRVALTSVLFALAHHPGTILGWCLYVFTRNVSRASFGVETISPWLTSSL